MRKWLESISGKELKLFSIFTIILLFIAAVTTAFAARNPMGLINGMKLIVISRDALITDYFELTGYGAALLNGALVLGISTFLIIRQKIPFTGPTMAALFINAGYAFWGKNPVNIIPVILGTALYARIHNSKLSRYIYTALFGTCLAPLLTELYICSLSAGR